MGLAKIFRKTNRYEYGHLNKLFVKHDTIARRNKRTGRVEFQYSAMGGKKRWHICGNGWNQCFVSDEE